MTYRKSNHYKLLNCSEDFHKIVKVESTKAGLSIFDFTDSIANRMKEERKDAENKKFSFKL